MLFNKKYDSSLWLILSGDKKNRDLILNFIKSIPKKIYEELSKYLLNENINGNLYGEVKGKNHLLYMYSVNSKSKELCIGKCIRYKGNYSEIFIISLLPYEELEVVDNMFIGRVSYAVKNVDSENIIDCDKIDYSLFKTPFGIFLKKYCEFSPIVQTLFNRFDTMDEIDCCEFSDVSVLNKLVSKKQRRKVKLR